jgi:hypothetical protein
MQNQASTLPWSFLDEEKEWRTTQTKLLSTIKSWKNLVHHASWFGKRLGRIEEEKVKDKSS